MWFKINNAGIARNKYVRKEGIRGLIFGPIYSFVMMFLTYISMSKWLTFFYVVSPFLLLMMILFFIVAPVKMLKRHNRTIKMISFEEGKIKIEVFSALWYKAKKVELQNRKDAKISNTRFLWYGKEPKEGFKLKTKNEEYYLVLDYFDDQELIQNQLSASAGALL